jgi:CRISPR/Cas system-associated exonuclease Cas4 (RecB family)
MLAESIEPLTQFGTAGLMGALWIYERLLSRRRETQLNAAHDQLMKQQRELNELIQLVRHNTRAIKAFERTQSQLKVTLERIHHDLERKTAA